MFVQPFKYSQRIKKNSFICFITLRDLIDETSFELLEDPKFLNVSDKNLSDDLVRNYKYVRIVITNEYLEKIKNSCDIDTKYQFKEYTIKNSGKTFVISKELEFSEFQSNCSDILEFFADFYLSILLVNDPHAMLPSYDFTSPYSGWHFIAFPFICYIEGLSQVPEKFICGRIVHLPQSSGHGKTRVCFELLGHEKSGIYCVYRSGDSTGFPPTTSWMMDLIKEFEKSSSYETSMYICAKFIKDAIIHFKDYGERSVDNISLFRGQLNGSKTFKPQFQANIKYDTIIKEIIDLPLNKVFTFIFDECHELLITSKSNLDGVSLYHYLRRVFFKIKKSPIVAIFLGTKSSLSDFVLNAQFDPSARLQVNDPIGSFQVPVYLFTHAVDSMLTGTYFLSSENVRHILEVSGKIRICFPEILADISKQTGRPLWNSYKSFEEAFIIAQTKLVGEKSLCELTALIMRTGSSVVPQNELAHKLVLSGMATLMYVDSQFSRTSVEYIPEPMLSNVSRILLTKITSFSKALSEYVGRLQLGAFHDTGNGGELVARIVLLRAMDLAVLKYASGMFENKYVTPFSSQDILGTETKFEPEFRSVIESEEFQTFSETVDSDDHVAQRDVDSPYLSPKLGLVTLKRYLLLFAGLDEESCEEFGVSDETLNGMVSLNQFVQADKPQKGEDFVIDQQYLLHCFARSCGLILPPGTKGIDLLIPVLRTDSKMSCVVVQVKNVDVDTFPNDCKNSMNRLKASALQFLDLGDSCYFKALDDKDDFVRIVIQFSKIRRQTRVKKKKTTMQANRLKADDKEKEEEISEDYVWVQIPNSKKSAFWVLGFRGFENLFFWDKVILKNLYVILSGQRNFFNTVEFPSVQLPTTIQTTRSGAEFLTLSARTLSTYKSVIIHDAFIRAKSLKSQKIYDEFLKTFDSLQLPNFALEFRNKAAFVPLSKIEAQNLPVLPVASEEQISSQTKKYLEKVITKNKDYRGKETLIAPHPQKSNIDADESEYEIEFEEEDDNLMDID